MKKIDKLIIKAFVGPFILTFAVVVFILLTVQMMQYVDEIFGKNLAWHDLAALVFHFSVFQTPIAFPLSVMLASLMTFGNLGEHFELTAIKSAGISLLRALRPIFIFVLIVTVIAFYSNNYYVPYSALKAYSLLYDIKQTKPALDIQPGLFYEGIDNYKIKIDKKYPDGKSLKGLIIYDHTARKGNTEMILADSGKMYTILNDQYLKFELFNGTHYSEGDAPRVRGRKRGQVIVKPFTRTAFKRSEIIFDLSSFSMSRTDEGLFANHRFMRNFTQLRQDLDSLNRRILTADAEIYGVPERYFTYSKIKRAVDLPPEIEYINKLNDSLRTIELEQQRMLEASRQQQYAIGVRPPPTYGISLLPPSRGPSTGRKQATKTRPANQQKHRNANEKKNLPPAGKVKTGAAAVAVWQRQQKKVKATQPNKGEQADKATRTKPDMPRIVEAEKQELPYLDSTFNEQEVFILARLAGRMQQRAYQKRALKTAVATARQIKSKLTAQNTNLERMQEKYYEFDIQWQKMLATAFACITMFLIGAPLGAIIKRGGIGFPVIVSIMFFIIYYVISIGGEKYAQSGSIPVIVGVWAANIILLPVGLFFLRQAKNDARLFDADFYKVVFARITDWLRQRLPGRKAVGV
ncbi:MAG TPA: LptF/LptG family permease [Flammeovirgaceae bacterium]|nr:LptF/LptG family permease [Flammeovirgaceae bacterium]